MRITKVTTRSGDTGESSLADGSRHLKTDAVFAALGSVDELNSHIGVLITTLRKDKPDHSQLTRIQSQLFDLGGTLALPGPPSDTASEVAARLASNCDFLESLIEQYNQNLPPLKEFILPGGCEQAAQAQLARAVCRRAERCLWKLIQNQPESYSRTMAVYLNRLSDLLYLLARTFNSSSDTPEASWQRDA